MNIGCVTLVLHDGKIVGIDSKKNRGNILPGGKWEPGESFTDCAKREYFEETGLTIDNLEYIFGGVSEEGFYTYAFTATLAEGEDFDRRRHNGDEYVIYTSWTKLKASKFGGFYELFEQQLKAKAHLWKFLDSLT